MSQLLILLIKDNDIYFIGDDKMKRVSSALELIHNTPLIELKKLKKELNLFGNIYAKLESFNLTGSVKDRIVACILENMSLKKGDTIIEATSGNTGISLSAIGALKGLRVIIIMPENMSKERQKIIKAYGGQVIITPKHLGMDGAVNKAKELLNKAYNYSNNPYALINLINMDLHERKYEEAYEKLLKLKQNLIFNKDCKYHYDAISIFLNSKLDKKINVKQSIGYRERQLEEYDKTCALTHIFRHVYQDIYNKNIHTVFANNIDVEYLFNNVPNMLNEDNYFYTNIFDEYYLNIDNVGLNGENYLIVGCIPGTKDIVSMYPIKYNPIKKVRS